MSESPLKKNYIKKIPQQLSVNFIKSQKSPKQLNQSYLKLQLNQRSSGNRLQIYNNCISKVLVSQNNRNDRYQLNIFDNGIFNINKIRITNYENIKQVIRNTNKSCIVQKQRLLKSIYFFPNQTIVECQYNLQNKLHKSMILYNPGKYLIIKNFTHGHEDKQQYNFNIKQMNMIRSVYNLGKLINVKDYCLDLNNQHNPHVSTYQHYYHHKNNINNTQNNKNNKSTKFMIKLQKYLKDKQLCKFQWLNQIQFTHQNSTYYGQINYKTCLPNGLGILITRNQSESQSRKNSNNYQKKNNHKKNNIDNDQKSISSFRLTQRQQQNQQTLGWDIYYGYFKHGILQTIGSIWFNNRNTYFGQFQKGNFIGYGQFYQNYQYQQNQNQNQYFYYKNGKKKINKQKFNDYIKQQIFNGNNKLQYKANFKYIQQEYEKLKIIYFPIKIIKPQRQFRKLSKQKNQEKQETNKIKTNANFFNFFNDNKQNDQQQNQNQNQNQQTNRYEYPQQISFKNQQVKKSNKNKHLIKNLNLQKNIKNKQSITDIMKNLVNNNKKSDNLYNINNSDPIKNNDSSTNRNHYHNNIERNNTSQSRNNYTNRQNYHKQNINSTQRYQNQQQLYDSLDKYQNRQIDLGCQEIIYDDQNNKLRFDRNDIQKQYTLQRPQGSGFPHQFIGQNQRLLPSQQYQTTISPFKRINNDQIHNKHQTDKLNFNLQTPQKKLFTTKSKQNVNIIKKQEQLKNFQRIINKGKIKRIFVNKKENHQ